MQPVMTAEAERMLSKLRTMQTEIDGLRSELRRKEAALEVSKATIERLEVKFVFLYYLRAILNLIYTVNVYSVNILSDFFFSNFMILAETQDRTRITF